MVLLFGFTLFTIVVLIRFRQEAGLDERRVLQLRRAVYRLHAELCGGREVGHVNPAFEIKRTVQSLCVEGQGFRHLEEDVGLIIVALEQKRARAFCIDGN